MEVEKAKPNLVLTSADTISATWSDHQTHGLDTYEYNYSQARSSVLKEQCYTDHKGSGNITTTLGFAGEQSQLKTHFSWKG